ncbi:hypothetical protein EDC96DRAFT_414271, partial [Choanephora cucurbitarum]
LLFHRRLSICIEPIFWLPMTYGEHIRCLRWRLGWLSLRYSMFCSIHPLHSLTK